MTFLETFQEIQIDPISYERHRPEELGNYKVNTIIKQFKKFITSESFIGEFENQNRSLYSALISSTLNCIISESSKASAFEKKDPKYALERNKMFQDKNIHSSQLGYVSNGAHIMSERPYYVALLAKYIHFGNGTKINGETEYFSSKRESLLLTCRLLALLGLDTCSSDINNKYLKRSEQFGTYLSFRDNSKQLEESAKRLQESLRGSIWNINISNTPGLYRGAIFSSMSLSQEDREKVYQNDFSVLMKDSNSLQN